MTYRSFQDHEQGRKLKIHLVEVDLRDPRMRLEIALAHGKASGEERVQGMAERNAALAAINGSFFHGARITTSVGLVLKEGEIIADSRHRRTSLGINPDHSFVMGIPRIQTGLYFPDRKRFQLLSGVNQPRRGRQTVVYTPRFGGRTHTNLWGCEVIVENNRIRGYGTGNTRIPPGGFIISAQGKSSREIQQIYPIGREVMLQARGGGEWKHVQTLLTGAPHLVHRGRIHNTYFQERLQASLKAPNARSAVGYTHNHKLLLVNVFPAGRGGGVTFTGLARIMRRLGAVEAMGLDGGGSTSMYVSDKSVRHGPRPVTNALIVTMIPRPLLIPGRRSPVSRICEHENC